MNGESKEAEPKMLEVRFGMIFAHWFEGKCSLHVVVDPGRDNWFETSQVVYEKGEIRLCIPGTADPTDVHLQVGQLGKEQILEGFDNLFEAPTSKTIVDIIERNSLKPARVLLF